MGCSVPITHTMPFYDHALGNYTKHIGFWRADSSLLDFGGGGEERILKRFLVVRAVSLNILCLRPPSGGW